MDATFEKHLEEGLQGRAVGIQDSWSVQGLLLDPSGPSVDKFHSVSSFGKVTMPLLVSRFAT